MMKPNRVQLWVDQHSANNPRETVQLEMLLRMMGKEKEVADNAK